MPPEDHIRIQHMIDAAETAIQFAKGRKREDLEKDRMVLFAIVRAVEILGEAASKVSDETRKEAPQIPWRTIVAMRNRLIHGYFDIDVEIVWQTTTREIPELLPQIKGLIETS